MVGYLVTPILTLIGALPEADKSAYFGDGGLSALKVTLIAATVATLGDALLGIPLGFWLSRTESRLRHAVTAGVLVPLAIPPVVGGLVIVLWLGPQGWLGGWLDRHGLGPLNTLGGTILAQMFVAAPFVILSSRAAFSGVDRWQEDTARTLGCTPLQTLARVVVPSARRGLATGLVLGWVRCLGELGATAVVAYHPYTLPVLTYVRLSGEGLPTALPAGALLAAVGGMAAGLILWLDARQRHAQVAPASLSNGLATDSIPLSWIVPIEQRNETELRVEVRAVAERFHLDATFEAPPGVTALLGASGAGKSLTLRAVAGLIRPDRGRIEISNRRLLDTEAGIDVPPEGRNLGYVAQGGGLFDHLSVESNIGFGLGDWPDRARRIEELIASFHLASVRHARPETLSGGERHRVALARALAPGPRGLLLDEPFVGLDAPVRHDLRTLLRDLHERTRIPVLFVTHDRDDALDLADHVAVLERGRVVQSGAIAEVFARPVDRYVARLVGIPNVVAVRAIEPTEERKALVTTEFGGVVIDARPEDFALPCELAIPSTAIAIDPAGHDCEIRSVRPSSAGWRVVLQCKGASSLLEALVMQPPPPGAPGQSVKCGIVIDSTRCQLMRAPND
jgi:molybdate transport system permease protein